MKRLWAWMINHQCWFGVPHKGDDGVMQMVCYGCGRTKRLAVNLEAR